MRLTTLALALAFAAPLAAQDAQPAPWTPRESNTSAEFRGLSVVSTTVAWASGTHGRVIHTTDGGAHWQLDSIAGAGAYDLRDIQAFDGNTAVAITSGDAADGQAHIYRTTDGARTWREVWSSTQKGVFLDALAFWDAQRGLALSDPIDGKPYLLETRDGGTTWTRIPPDGLPAMLDGEAFFAASGTCLTTGADGRAYIATGGARSARVLRSSDYGHTWRAAELPLQAGSAAAGAFSVAFRDATHGVAVGGDYTKANGDVPNIAVTNDGGATWHLAAQRVAGYWSSVSPVPQAGGWIAVGLAGTITGDATGEHWTLADAVPYNSAAFVASAEKYGYTIFGVTVGPRGRVATHQTITKF